MEVTVQLTAHHQGFFEFRLCNHNDPTTPGTLECLNEWVLSKILPLIKSSCY